jgi:peptidoglycan-associated lipoprotein
VPVEDRTGRPSRPAASTAPRRAAAAQSQVAPVVRTPPPAPPPAPPTWPASVLRLRQLRDQARGAGLIDAHARFLKANPQRRIALEGHTDERGGREYNLALGQRRAEAVRRALALLGVADNQMEAVSFGKEKPAVVGADEAAWAQNRRVEIAYR